MSGGYSSKVARMRGEDMDDVDVDRMLDVRLPPHSVEAEQHVIGGLLIEASAFDEVADVVTASDFYRPDHRVIFEAIAALVSDGIPCDITLVSEHLERNGRLEHVGGLAYLGTIARDTPSAANIRHYAGIVHERSLLRRLGKAGADISTSIFSNDGETAKELVSKAESAVFSIAEDGARGSGAVQIGNVIHSVLEEIDERQQNPDKLAGLPTGFIDFDRLTGGLRPGDLVVVAGRPAMGKTTLAVNMGEYAALKSNIKAPVAIFSMEMPTDQLVTRMLSSVGGVPLNSLRNGRVADNDWDRIMSATSQLKEAKILIDETPGLSPMELRARARRLKREHGLGLIIVDYIQLMQVPGYRENRTNEVGEITRGLKIMAKELSVPVIALSQLNRSVEQRENKRPVMADLRESGSIEQDADMILMIYREEVYDKNTTKQGIAEIGVVKHRNGEIGSFNLTFQGQFSRFANYAPDFYAPGVMR